jgi:hypothetical protein
MRNQMGNVVGITTQATKYLTFLSSSTGSNRRCNCSQCKLYCGLSSNYLAVIGGVSQKTSIMVAASLQFQINIPRSGTAAYFGPSGRRRKHAVFRCNKPVLFHLSAPPRSKMILQSVNRIDHARLNDYMSRRPDSTDPALRPIASGGQFTIFDGECQPVFR